MSSLGSTSIPEKISTLALYVAYQWAKMYNKSWKMSTVRKMLKSWEILSKEAEFFVHDIFN